MAIARRVSLGVFMSAKRDDVIGVGPVTNVAHVTGRRRSNIDDR